MKDVHLYALAGAQANRISRQQLFDLGYSPTVLKRRVASGRLVLVEPGVFALPPVLDDPWGRRWGAVLTSPDSFLAAGSAGAAYGFWPEMEHFQVVVRPGSGGPRRFGEVLVLRSSTLEGDTTELNGIPITTPERTLLDLAPHVSAKALARALRECVRLTDATLSSVMAVVLKHRGRRGSRKLALACARYAGLPLERARSGAEVRALEILRSADRPIPELNRRIAGEEADLVFRRHRLIIEIDGGPFHADVGEDARKEAAWRAAGWTVLRISSDDVYEHPERLLALAPTT